MYAPEDDGPGDGHERGWLYQGKVEYMVAENMLRPKDKLSTYILMDVLEPAITTRKTIRPIFCAGK
jgi:hypothetical protein